MGMPGKPGQIVLWVFVAKVVKEQEGIRRICLAEAKSSVEFDAGSLLRRTGLHGGFYGAYRQRHLLTEVLGSTVLYPLRSYLLRELPSGLSLRLRTPHTRVLERRSLAPQLKKRRGPVLPCPTR